MVWCKSVYILKEKYLLATPPTPPSHAQVFKRGLGGGLGGGGELKKWENIAMQMIIARQFSEH